MKADRSEVAPEARVVDHNPLECNELATEGCGAEKNEKEKNSIVRTSCAQRQEERGITALPTMRQETS